MARQRDHLGQELMREMKRQTQAREAAEAARALGSHGPDCGEGTTRSSLSEPTPLDPCAQLRVRVELLEGECRELRASQWRRRWMLLMVSVVLLTLVGRIEGWW